MAGRKAKNPGKGPFGGTRPLRESMWLSLTGVTSGYALELDARVGLRITEADIQFIFGYVFLNS
jgi:hypothetical protein